MHCVFILLSKELQFIINQACPFFYINVANETAAFLLVVHDVLGDHSVDSFPVASCVTSDPIR